MQDFHQSTAKEMTAAAGNIHIDYLGLYTKAAAMDDRSSI